jgi:pilus assembly protein Flp/PilA
MHYIEEASGQGLVEYALLLVLVAVAIVFALAAFGRTVTNLFDQIYDSLAAI